MMEIGQQLELVLRLAAGLILGAAVGWERELQRMPAGFRTHALVGLGSAVFTVVGAYAFTGTAADPTRVAAQIVSGIGFLGGGAILHHGGNVRGLTTAASLWAVAAVGMAAGAGLYIIAFASAVLVIIALDVFDRVERTVKRRLRIPTKRTGPDEPDGPTADEP